MPELVEKLFESERVDRNKLDSFFSSIRVNVEILEKFHTGIAIFNKDALLVFANTAYKKMYRFKERDIIGLNAIKYFLTAGTGIVELLRTGEPNSCQSVTIDGLYGITWRWPLRDDNGQVAACLTENISVSSARDKINEASNLLAALDHFDGHTVINPRQSLEPISFDDVIGESRAMRRLKERGRHFAMHNEPVLILGENGTGKDLIAQAIHVGSQRHERNFVTVNCAAIPNELLESELFGYEAGAFSGARASGKKGYFELAEGGTIFLDEIGEMPLSLQAKLLRVLENHQIQKIGAQKASYIDFRLLSATNRDIEQLVEDGLFREDLYYRLNMFELVVPPLRERLADIPLLCKSITENILGPDRAGQINFLPEVLAAFSAYHWRGNVRELRNILTYALYSIAPTETRLGLGHLPERFFQRSRDYATNEAEKTKISTEDAAFHKMETPSHRMRKAPITPCSRDTPLDDAQGETGGILNLASMRKQSEEAAIRSALAECYGNKTAAARRLGIARSNLYKKLKQMEITGENNC